ncbi:hypothetical protein [Mangrovicoccus ximenensis]|uniref:hypothetical protein n=1 Tax=Mangrovicoccus ximenensis TaxID=1911570 RepID=UPI001374DCF6|nr:hypothetical protein [Mangrovicoccus ximenensis]
MTVVFPYLGIPSDPAFSLDTASFAPLDEAARAALAHLAAERADRPPVHLGMRASA